MPPERDRGTVLLHNRQLESTTSMDAHPLARRSIDFSPDAAAALVRLKEQDTHPPADQGPTHASDQAEWADLLATLRALEPNDREAIVLIDILGFTPAEAAALIDVSPGALRVRLHRAHGRFRERHER